VGGNLAWIAWPDSLEAFHQLLAQKGTYGMILRGDAPRALIGMPLHSPFLHRIRAALDPIHRFVDFE
jgi:hypothetical protein